MKKIALLHDSSNHGGEIITSNQDGTVKVGGVEIAVNGALHSCPMCGITTAISAITTISKCNGKLIITEQATAGCGAEITPPDRKVYVE